MARLRSRQQDGGAAAIPQRVHLVGAGGIHVSAIGTILLQRGHTVTGSDLNASEYTRRLEALGGTIFTGHHASNLGDAELVVATAAARDDNPELVEARARGLPVIVRAEMVQRLVAPYDLLAVAGSHGKTTTSSMLALMAVQAGLDPLVLLGGDSHDLGGNARDGAGTIAIVEADEYAEAFLQYEPSIALVTNIEADHLDYFGTEERYANAFSSFAARVRPDGVLIVCEDSPGAARLGEERRSVGARVERYALDATDVEWRATQLRGNDDGGLDCTVLLEGAELGRLSLQVPGRHNLANALGALAVGMRAGVDFHRAAQAVAGFTGVARRFDLVAEVETDGAPITLMDDYAVHPTEVRVVLSTARQRFSGRRLVACFQPHTYSRASYLLEGFRSCFEGLDALYVLRTYAAREQAQAGMDARALAAEIAAPPPQYLDSLDEATERIAAELRPGDVFFTLGAGDVTELGPMLRDRLEGAS